MLDEGDADDDEDEDVEDVGAVEGKICTISIGACRWSSAGLVPDALCGVSAMAAGLAAEDGNGKRTLSTGLTFTVSCWLGSMKVLLLLLLLLLLLVS